MKQKNKLLLLLVLLMTAATGAWAQSSGTKIYSVDFSDYTSYPFYNASESATVENGLLVLTNSTVYDEKYKVQPEIGRPTPITAGKCYRVTIEYKTTVGGPVNVVLGAQDWSTMMGAWWVPITVSDNFQTLEATFLKCSYGATDNHILFQFGDLVGTVYIKKVEVYEFDYVAVTGVTLSSSTASVNMGDKVALTATVAPDDATEKTVKWSVGGTNADAVKLYTDEACTTEVGSDATSALTVFAKGMSAGEATVTVVASSDETKSATCTITVNPTYTVSLKDGVKDADKWTVKVGEGQAQALPIGGLKGDGSETVTVTYSGSKKVLGLKAEKKAATKVLYSWESPEGTPTETGGTIAYVNGDTSGGDRVNYLHTETGIYTICLNGKKTNITDGTASQNSGRMDVTLDEALAAGDVITITAYIYKSDTGASSDAYVIFNGANGFDSSDMSVYAESEAFDSNNNLYFSGAAKTVTVKVPTEAAGRKSFSMTRGITKTNLFITKLTISRGN